MVQMWCGMTRIEGMCKISVSYHLFIYLSHFFDDDTEHTARLTMISLDWVMNDTQTDRHKRTHDPHLNTPQEVNGNGSWKMEMSFLLSFK